MPAEPLHGPAQAGHSRLWLAALAVLMIALVLFFSADLVWRGLEPRWPGPDLLVAACASLAGVLMLRTALLSGGDRRLRFASGVLFVLFAYLLGRNLLWMSAIGVAPAVAVLGTTGCLPIAALLTFSNLNDRARLLPRVAIIAATLATAALIAGLSGGGDGSGSVAAALTATAAGGAWLSLAIVSACVLLRHEPAR